MYFPAIHDERTTLRNYLQVQLQAIRDAAHGLTDEQARQQSLASVFSVSGVMEYNTMRIRFWGAAGEVTGSCYEVECGERRFLVDCGVHDRNRLKSSALWVFCLFSMYYLVNS